MTARPTIQIETAQDGASGDGWMRPLMARQVEALGWMAEAGLDIVMDLRRQALDGAGEGAAPVNAEALALAFSRASRAVRMTFALQTKAMQDLQHYDHLAASEPSTCPPASPNDASFTYADMTPEDRRLNRVQRIVERVIEAEHGQDTEIAERLVGLSFERLEESEDLYDAVLSRPLSAVVAEICEDLGLTPDWSLLVDEPWARREIDSGAVGDPLAQWMATRAQPPPTSSSLVCAKRKTEDPASPPLKRGAPVHPGSVKVIPAGFPRQARE